MTTQHSHTSCITTRNIVGVVGCIQFNFFIRHWVVVIIIIQRTYIGLTTTTIDILDGHSLAFNLHKQTFRTGHTSFVTTTIEVADDTLLQVPLRTDGHVGLIVATKDTGKVEGITGQVALRCGDI